MTSGAGAMTRRLGSTDTGRTGGVSRIGGGAVAVILGGLTVVEGPGKAIKGAKCTGSTFPVTSTTPTRST